MIPITKDEAEFLRSVDPTTYIAITGRTKRARHKHRYVCENIDTLRLLTNNEAACKIVAAHDRWMRGRRRG